MIFEWLVQLLFGSLYGLLVTGIALLAAIPYGIWQGIKWLSTKITGGPNGNSRTGS